MKITGVPKDLKRILREAEGKGWFFDWTKSAHIRGKHIDGVRIVFISSTPSDRRALHNVKKDLGL